MIVDSSAVMAIFLQEPDSERFLQAIAENELRRMSVANWLEVTMVIGGRDDATAQERFERFVDRMSLELVPVSVEQATAAHEGWRRFGRGNHPARLNYGDCFAYALAKTSGEPLLYKGDDFPQTDIPSALTP